MSEISWPVSDPAVKDCDAHTVASLSIMAGAGEAVVNTTTPITNADVAFWARVREERERIAAWVIDGLGISGRAR
jgi:hypothetical protein